MIHFLSEILALIKCQLFDNQEKKHAAKLLYNLAGSRQNRFFSERLVNVIIIRLIWTPSLLSITVMLLIGCSSEVSIVFSAAQLKLDYGSAMQIVILVKAVRNVNSWPFLLVLFLAQRHYRQLLLTCDLYDLNLTHHTSVERKCKSVKRQKTCLRRRVMSTLA